MKIQFKNGSSVEVSDLPTIDLVIKDMETELKRVRRLRKVVAEMTGVEEEDEGGDETPTEK